MLRLSLPDESLIWAPSNDVGENPAAGVGDTPPRIDDGGTRGAAASPGSGSGRAPGSRSIACRWRGSASTRSTSISARRWPGACWAYRPAPRTRSSQLPQGSVDPDTLQVQVEEPGRGYQPWNRVDDLAAISADARVAREAAAFELDAEAGTLRFGDGVRGRVPERQMRVRLASGRFGGGRAGNLPADSLTEIAALRIDGSPAPAVKVAQPLATIGGADAETIAGARAADSVRISAIASAR